MTGPIDSSAAVRNASTSDQLSLVMLRKTLDAQKDEGSQIVQMIRQAAATGQQTSGGGRGLDVYA
jgi:hypothetical protein